MATDEIMNPDLCVPSRHEKSLGLLTTKFVTLLQEAKDGVLDLKVAADTLAVRQKRRIYDITNVLEGIGLIEKKSKNSIQWKGAGPACNTQEVSDRLEVLKEEIAILEAEEERLDTHSSWITQSLSNIADDLGNSQLAYLNHEDVCACFPDDTMLVIQAPPGTQLDVPVPDSTNARQRRYQICLKSRTGPISVVLVNKDSQDSKPTVMQVPPDIDESFVVNTDSGATEKTLISKTMDVDNPEALSKVSVSDNISIPMESDIVVDECDDQTEEKGKNKKKDKKEKESDKKTSPKTPLLSPSKITTRAAAVRLQQQMQQLRQLEGRTTRQGTKFTTPIVKPSVESVDVTPVVSPLSRKRQSPRKGQLPVAKVSSTETPTTTTTITTATTTINSPTVISEEKMQPPILLTTCESFPVSTVPPVIAGKKFVSDSSTTDDYMDDFMSSEIFSPLLRLSPPPSDRDYYFNLDDTEGLCDLFDVPMLQM